MARRPTTPARRKRRTAVCAVLLPLLLAALLLVLDVPFLTARGALAATQERYAFGPGEVIARFSPQQEGMPPLRYYIVRDGDWFAWCSVEGDGLFWRPGALTAACPDGEAPLAILASPTFGGTSPELVVVSSDPDIAAVELDYLVKSAIIDTVVTFTWRWPVRSRWRIRAFTSLWRTPIPASFMRRLPPFSASGTMTRTESCSTSLPIPPAGWNTRSSTPI